MTASARISDEGCEITVTGDSVGWLYPPLQDGLAKIVWEKADGGNLIGINNNDTVAIHPGVTVLVRLCGYEDASLVTMSLFQSRWYWHHHQNSYKAHPPDTLFQLPSG